MQLTFNIELKDYSRKTVAETIFNSFLYNFSEHVRQTVIVRAELNAWIAANKAYEYEMRDELGWSSPPYSTEQIKLKTEQLVRVEKQESDSRVMIQFLRDEFLKAYLDKP